MSQFEGNKLKVRCADCSKFAGNRCAVKDVKVTPKKKRSCHLYEFTGTYSNREGMESIYVPHVDKKTRKMLKKLIAQRVLPVAEGGSVEIRDGFAKVKTLDMPASTATAPLAESKIDDHREFSTHRSPKVAAEDPVAQ